MTKLKVFEVILKDGQFAYVKQVVATSKKAAIAYCAGNGDVVSCDDNTTFWKDYLLSEQGIMQMDDTLKSKLYGKDERDIINQLLNLFN